MVVALGFIAAEIVVVLLLKQVAPENAFGAVLLLGVLVVSAGWGFRLAVATSVVSALAYVYFHLEGSDSLAAAVVVFLTLALLVNLIAGQARLRAEEADQRRREADLSAELARVLLRATELRGALTEAGDRLAEVLALRYAILSLDERPAADGAVAVGLRDGDSSIGTLVVPGDLEAAARRRLRRMVPSLEALLAAAREREERLRAAQLLVEAGHAEVTALARQQAALRRVATMVARGAEPGEVYPAAVAQLADGLGADHVTLVEFDTDDSCVVLAAQQGPAERNDFVKGERLLLDGDSVTALIRRTGAAARVDDYTAASGPIAARLRQLGLRSGVGAPVVVDGGVRAAIMVGSSLPEQWPAETEARLGDFADLVGTAIFNAETRAEITASRARIVAAADHARRGFERDLHDGAQQRIVSLGLQLRAVESALPADLDDVREQLNRAVEGLGGLYTDLQELSRGLHPAILSRGGLGPAIKTLARRSAVPVRLDVSVDGRLPESVEVAAYYVIAEALTNAAKHSRAGEVTVTVGADSAELSLQVGDNGVGGALSGGGSGLIGLKDRVEALSGRFRVVSPAGGGTTLEAVIPTGKP